MSQPAPTFECKIQYNADGHTFDAMYITFKQAEYSYCTEHNNVSIVIDHDANDHIIGIEILSPVSINDLLTLIDVPLRDHFRTFVLESVPPHCITHN